MAVNKVLLFVFSCGLFDSSTGAPSIASHFTRCSLKDPELENCLLTQARAVWPHLAQGVKKWKVPSLDPIHVSKISLSESGNQAVNVIMRGTNFTFTGFKDINIESVKVDVRKLHFEFTFLNPLLGGDGQYELKGKLLLLPIQGQGYFNVTHVSEHVRVSMDFKRVEEGGKKLLKLENAEYKVLDIADITHYFDNLFGNKQLSDNMNEVLTINRRQVFNDLKPRIELTFGELVFTLFEPMFNSVDIRELFDDVD